MIFFLPFLTEKADISIGNLENVKHCKKYHIHKKLNANLSLSLCNFVTCHKKASHFTSELVQPQV